MTAEDFDMAGTGILEERIKRALTKAGYSFDT